MKATLAGRLVLPEADTIAVALSGGGDSVALLHLLRQAGKTVRAVTVDHRLRPESADEAARVAGWCGNWGIAHDTLVWNNSGDPGGNLMDRASRARQALINDWALGQGFGTIALGHTADDQAENLLIGLSRAAGIDGLCGLRPAFHADGLRWTRPLLALGRGELRQWLTENGLPWIDDPSNRNDRYLRVRMRKALASLAPLGLTADRLAASASHLAAARVALDAVVAIAAPSVMAERAGALQIDRAAFAALPPETARRMLQSAVLWLSGHEYPPRAADLARLAASVTAGGAATLAGCRLKDGWLAVERKAARPLRWQVQGKGDVRLLGPEGLRQCPDWRATGLPRHVLEVTPGLWQDDTLIAAPAAAFSPATATCAPSFDEFLLSH